jgi:hypothetical protein
LYWLTIVGMLSDVATYMPSLPDAIICSRSTHSSSCLLPMESSVQRISCNWRSTCRPRSSLNAAFQVSPSLVAIWPPIEYSSAVKCQPPVLFLL